MLLRCTSDNLVDCLLLISELGEAANSTLAFLIKLESIAVEGFDGEKIVDMGWF
jgi:hypothetical protein